MLKNCIFFSILAFTSLTLVCSSILANTICVKFYLSKTETNSIDESYAVYSVALKKYESSSENGQKAPIIVINENTEIGNIEKKSNAEFLRNFNLEVPAEFQSAFEDFKSKNIKSEKLIKSFDIAQDYVLVTKDDVFKSENINEIWKLFYKKYPDSRGLITFSKVGFDADKKHAFIYQEQLCGFLCAEGGYVFLTKEQGEWKITKRMITWVS